MPADPRHGDNAVLERLAQRLEHGRGNSGSSSSSSTPRCARLASPGRGDAPPPTIAAVEAPWWGARNGGARMIGRPGRSVPATEWMRVTSSASSRVSGGRMPGSRRASIVLPVPGGPASRTLCSPAAASSSARRPRSWPRTSARSGRNGSSSSSGPGGEANGIVLFAPKVGDRLGEVMHGHGADSRQRRLGRGLRGAEESPEAGTPSAFRDGDRARDRAHPPVERELAHAAVLEQPARGQLAVSRENGECDRQVEPRALLAERRGREVHGDAILARPGQHRVDDAAVHAVLGLLAGAVGEPNDRERGQVGADEVSLDLDAPWLEADDGGGEGAREHTTDGTGEILTGPSRLCAETARGGARVTVEHAGHAAVRADSTPPTA